MSTYVFFIWWNFLNFPKRSYRKCTNTPLNGIYGVFNRKLPMESIESFLSWWNLVFYSSCNSCWYHPFSNDISWEDEASQFLLFELFNHLKGGGLFFNPSPDFEIRTRNLLWFSCYHLTTKMGENFREKTLWMFWWFLKIKNIISLALKRNFAFHNGSRKININIFSSYSCICIELLMPVLWRVIWIK